MDSKLSQAIRPWDTTIMAQNRATAFFASKMGILVIQINTFCISPPVDNRQFLSQCLQWYQKKTLGWNANLLFLVLQSGRLLHLSPVGTNTSCLHSCGSMLSHHIHYWPLCWPVILLLLSLIRSWTRYVDKNSFGWVVYCIFGPTALFWFLN